MLCCIKHCSRRVLLLLASCLTVDRPYGAVAGAVKESERRSRVASLSSFVRQARASGARWVAQVHGTSFTSHVSHTPVSPSAQGRAQGKARVAGCGLAARYSVEVTVSNT